jgi:hypothetical protein
MQKVLLENGLRLRDAMRVLYHLYHENENGLRLRDAMRVL